MFTLIICKDEHTKPSWKSKREQITRVVSLPPSLFCSEIWVAACATMRDRQVCWMTSLISFYQTCDRKMIPPPPPPGPFLNPHTAPHHNDFCFVFCALLLNSHTAHVFRYWISVFSCVCVCVCVCVLGYVLLSWTSLCTFRFFSHSVTDCWRML